MGTHDSFLSRQIDEYKIEALIGQGGMARVYRGVDVRLKRPVAIKIIDPPNRDDPMYVTRFEREAQVIAQFSHPNVIQLYRYGETDGYLYMVMQYVDGSDLHSVLSSYHSDDEFMEHQDALRIIREICTALDYVHQRGIVHRDIKPSNILLTRQGQAILSDFGLALITRLGTLGETFGSPQYMAPEQALSSAKAGPASDLYSVGVILYEIFTGRLPFYAKDSLEQAMLHVNAPVPSPRSIRPEITPELEAVILQALAKTPEERFLTGKALANALEIALRAEPILTDTPPTVSYLTLPERVHLKAAASPPVKKAPPLEEETSQPEGLPPIEEGNQIQLSGDPGTRRMLLFGGGILGALMVACLCLGVFIIAARLGSIGLPIASGITATSSPRVPATRTAGATPAGGQSIVTPSSETGLPPDISGPAYGLRLVKQGDQSLIVINNGDLTLPLAGLQLGNTSSRVSGDEWGIEMLKSGECVSILKNSKKAQLPAGLACTAVGTPLERNGAHRFWTTTFNLYYQGQYVGVCEQALSECQIHFTVKP